MIMPYVESYKEVDIMSASDMTEINKMLNEINEDRTVPRNIRNMIVEAKKHLNNEKDDMAVRISNAISILDEVSNDPNIPTYTRTHIWNIVSLLEIMRNGLK